MADADTYVANLRVEVLASSKQDAADVLREIADRLFGEDCLTTIVVPGVDQMRRRAHGRP